MVPEKICACLKDDAGYHTNDGVEDQRTLGTGASEMSEKPMSVNFLPSQSTEPEHHGGYLSINARQDVFLGQSYAPSLAQCQI